MKRSAKPTVLRAVRPNEGIEAAYRRKLDALVDEMQRSLEYWLAAAYRANQPEIVAASSTIAKDESPARTLRAIMRRLSRRWLHRFNDAAAELADYFAVAIAKRSDGALQSILKKAGFAVTFRMTATANDVLQATIAENVSLIKSIAQKHLTDVEGMVMRSVQAGRDLETLNKDLRHVYGVTKRRAALIALHQNNAATAAITRVRQTELGISQAVWMHSHGGKEPRPTHVANDGERYSVATGWYDPDEEKWIFPGQLINCRCVSRSIIPALDDGRYG